ncbi:O-acetylhomoserine aminocarboxypropyltransferase/cysteine synthase family protein [Bifidobacterium cuniculi]|uniref:homocysteine desulfhydrase n=1 Tax=Bifidobacterium cuniculi TaxID=1688 RepID=A0A087ALZ7_9BIFI|nr:aminotransferase class I/II-fold pyridoxal phosphate-dependent enzyme [Bifidobacterium cuniculi]KFI59797.1 cysteine synthase [Bifidobacterium cuniculi]
MNCACSGGFATQAIHAGYEAGDHGDAAVPPIYLSAAFDLRDTARGDALSAGEQDGFAYSRVGNPTVAVLEARICALEHGRSAVAFGSGMGAVAAALLTAAEGGGRIIAPTSLYGASIDALRDYFPGFGIDADFVDDINDLRAVEALIGPDTRAIFAESVANPSTQVTDVAGLAEVAHRHGVAVIVDNTVPTPYLFRPLEHGADVVVHSTTKGLCGHGNALGGIVVDGGTFDWGTARFPQFSAPDLAISDERCGAWRSFSGRYGHDAFAARVRAKALHNLGAVQGAMDAYLQLMGIETLAVRVREQVRSATAIAQWLRRQPQVTRLQYTGLLAGEDKENTAALDLRLAQERADGHATQESLVRRYFPHGVGGLLSFTLAGGRDQVRALIDATQLFTYIPNIGDTRSLIVDPARITHREVPGSFHGSAGVGDDVVRLSIGLEDTRDLLDDLEHAFARAYGATMAA